MARTKRQISMAEAAMVEKRTFIQPLDPLYCCSVEIENGKLVPDSIDVDALWRVFNELHSTQGGVPNVDIT